MVEFKAGAFTEMARCLMFGDGTIYPHMFGVEYRKGKGQADVTKAIRKALSPKNGRAKIEYELGMLETYLHGIFKPLKAHKVAA